MATGLVAGLVAFAVAKVVGERPLGQAVAYEARTAGAAGHGPGAPLVSRDVQSTLGLGLGTVLVGVAMGGLFALAFAFARGRIGTFEPRATAAAVGVVGFVAVFLGPFAVYPSTPPAATLDGSIEQRTALHFALVAMSLLCAVGAALVRRRLVPRLGPWDATLTAGAGYVAAMVALALGLPGVDEVPSDFPATVLWRFRVATVATQAALWATLAVGFGAATRRAERGGAPGAR